MGGSDLAIATGYDALTVVAALAHAGRPVTLGDLATALGWPRDRARAAVEVVQGRPAITDPLVLRVAETETYCLAVRDDRLSPAQRAALEN